MNDRRDLKGEMRTLLLDRDTADRLLTGHLQPDDSPPGYANVAELLSAAASFPSIDAEQEVVTVAAMVEEIRSHPSIDTPARGRTAMKRLARAKVAGVVVGATLMGTTGLAFAGALPQPAQRIAHSVFAKIGITVPATHSGFGSEGDTGIEPSPAASGDSQSLGAKGAQISKLARTTTAMGVAKGAIISAVASKGHSHAGENGHSGSPHGQSGSPHGQPGSPHGQSGSPHGQSGSPHGQSGSPHGQS